MDGVNAGERALREASAIRIQSSVRGKNKHALLRGAAIAAAAARSTSTDTPALAKLLDKYALGMLTHFSDVKWTEDRGHRTPVGSFGTFYQAPVVEEDDGLLDDL